MINSYSAMPLMPSCLPHPVPLRPPPPPMAMMHVTKATRGREMSKMTFQTSKAAIDLPEGVTQTSF